MIQMGGIGNGNQTNQSRGNEWDQNSVPMHIYTVEPRYNILLGTAQMSTLYPRYVVTDVLTPV
jgi:hypothetical protein